MNAKQNLLFIILIFLFYFNSILCKSITTLFEDDNESGPGIINIYYYTTWSKPYIHYDDGYGWTNVPGLLMSPSENSYYPLPNWHVKAIISNSLTFVFNDGNGNWDNNRGNNYHVSSPGVYSVQNGVLSVNITYPPACPGQPQCSGVGTCTSDYNCVCNPGYYGRSCESECPGGAKKPCNEHGSCNDGAFGDGSCNCDKGWGSCSSDPALACLSNLTSDAKNCGQCNSLCIPDESTSSAKCSNSICTRVCAQGYILCSNGLCQQGDNCVPDPLPGCQIFTDNQCSGDIIITPESYENRRWQTPSRNHQDYLQSYQDMDRLVGSTNIKYEKGLNCAIVEIIAIQKNSSNLLKYDFGDGIAQTSSTKRFCKGDIISPIRQMKIICSDGGVFVLADVDFVWDAPPVQINSANSNGDYRSGQKGAIVELFGWPHAEVEAECDFFAKAGYLGAKIFPAQEQLMSNQPFNDVLNPWYFMYQPVSYRLEGRMGTRNQLRQMIQSCRKKGVRIYMDAVINHMTGSGNDGNNAHRTQSGGSCVYWGSKQTSAVEVSPFYTQGFCYTYNNNTAQPPTQEFPSVPYGPQDFHCERALNSWTDPLDLNAGWLTGLVDLNTERENVQRRIAAYLTDIISIGFSGFRIDAAKHIQPDDLVAIFSYLKDNLGGSLPADFITWWEILYGGEAYMLVCNTNSGYNYGADLVKKLQVAGFSDEDINKIKIWDCGYPKEPNADCSTISLWRKAIQNDDADQQMGGSTSRDMGDQGSVLVVEKNVPKHRSFETKLFTTPNGASSNDNDYPIRLVLSSFYWSAPNGYGIPDGKSDCKLCTQTCGSCVSTSYSKAFDNNSCGYDSNNYTRVHRDKSIIMSMRQWMHLSTSVSNSQIGLPDNCV
eukprot:TRINITY_DN1732_c1_g1_i1.p1 TRINITY_DN1732_c1_g1~~TRINITY_DN1732_c1_g1_i1.p1  ORF type:complete len:881 (-),score=384.24 TRINITY_DN1732_c1_g1_i1:102-2744(-)